jgi:hypothetical protein
MEQIRVTALAIQVACTDIADNNEVGISSNPDHQLLMSAYLLQGIRSSKSRTRNHIFINNRIISRLPSRGSHNYVLSCPGGTDYPIALNFKESVYGGYIAFKSTLFSVDTQIVPGWFRNFFNIDTSFRGLIKGLMGNDNQNAYDDFMPNSKNATGALSVNSATAEEIHYQFGLTWNIMENESMFMYEIDRPYDVVNQADYKPIFNLTEMEHNCDSKPGFVNATNKLCGENYACKYDALATCDLDMAKDTVEDQNKIQGIQLQQNVTAVYPPAFNSSLGGSPGLPPPPPQKKFTLFYLHWEVY